MGKASPRKGKGRYGQGTVYPRKDSSFWWIKYFKDGKAFCESSRSTDRKEAQKLLSERVHAHEPPNKDSIGSLLDGLMRHYKMNRPKSYEWCKYVVEATLAPHFRDMKASKLGRRQLEEFVATRHEAGRANATIKNELALLQRSFSLRHLPMPKFQKPIVSNARQIILTDDEFELLYRNLPDHARIVALFGYETGCRLGEILGLKWDQADLHGPPGREGIVRLHVGETKNNQGRSIPLTTRLRVALLNHSASSSSSPYIFTYRGNQLKDIRGAWKTGCEKSGLVDESGKLLFRFHDLRRTSVTNMTRAGVPETMIMRISGHKTRSVFDRYNIVNEDDLHLAVNRPRVKNQKVSERNTVTRFMTSVTDDDDGET